MPALLFVVVVNILGYCVCDADDKIVWLLSFIYDAVHLFVAKQPTAMESSHIYIFCVNTQISYLTRLHRKEKIREIKMDCEKLREKKRERKSKNEKSVSRRGR